jgi:hypothetical protein
LGLINEEINIFIGEHPYIILIKGQESMDKKPLIGVSILAVVLLVLGSLSNVVGYQSVKSTAMNDSPLFQTRTQRATNQQQNSISSKYLGKGTYALTFPLRDNRTEQLKKAIDTISKMGDKTFAQFIELCIQKARQDNTFQGLSDYQIVQALLLLKTKPDSIINSITKRENYNMTSGYLTCDIPIACLWFLLLWPIWSLIWFILVELPGVLFPTQVYSCRSHCICQH